ncbi:short chain dehydrogenase/reductase family protein [Phakopsora pachyrhizi]|nr:short chain dehydrogenase/reductase family protein [Phakopsora pachyrhizi]
MSNAAANGASEELNRSLSLDSLFSVKGLVAVVTGGGTGIGLMCTQALAAHGARVYITGRRADALNKATENYHKHAKGEIIGIQADVTSKEDLERLVRQITEKEPNGIQILINNAGIAGPKSNIAHQDRPIEEFSGEIIKTESLEDWDSVWRTNVSGIYFTTVHFLPLLKLGSNSQSQYRSGVINISSMSGMIKVSQSHFCYNASKAAAIHLTKMMATDMGNLGIRFNSIAPGYFPSEMPLRFSRGKNDISDKFDAAERKVPAGRPGRLEEMAATVLYLCGKGGQYCDGLILNIDGGVLQYV